MRDVLKKLEDLSVPYILSEGSLLSLYRDFSTGPSDLDFSIELGWWKNHSQIFNTTLINLGLKRNMKFGDFGEVLLIIIKEESLI